MLKICHSCTANLTLLMLCVIGTLKSGEEEVETDFFALLLLSEEGARVLVELGLGRQTSQGDDGSLEKSKMKVGSGDKG